MMKVHLEGLKKHVFGFDENYECVITYLSVNDVIKLTGLSHRTLTGNVKERYRRFTDGITYIRSNVSIEQLRNFEISRYKDLKRNKLIKIKGN